MLLEQCYAIGTVLLSVIESTKMKEKFQTRIKCEFTQTMMVFNKRFSSLSIFEKKYNIAQRGNTHRYTSPTAIAAN